MCHMLPIFLIHLSHNQRLHLYMDHQHHVENDDQFYCYYQKSLNHLFQDHNK
ncbi:hypothetical protein ECP030526013_4687 [Escherichia coli P0305260.13]|nr:hypothetical protein ECP030526013_4687 [Escherichia coli P0305260.13]